ncbi:chemotaxis protein CheA [Frigoriglobus tundricola]|uniref:Chemotaxis protein CheA n=1 Tax=Frigoriglobus tundricola TaxID=2774151 RepID=A0A6M5YXL8_9BACT|nr:chemotaxis protein CheA [Frigoriglobus tundricola]QJW98240.1 Signal transduction histidine kinase CheA [Frigoriglobus tundricola]
MQIDMNQFRAVFFSEAAEHLDAIESGLLRLEANPADRDVLDAVFRGAHTIKGAGGTFGFPEIARFTHGMENLLDRARDGTVALTRTVINVLLRATDVLGGLIESAQTGAAPPPATNAVLDELQAAVGAGAAAAAGAAEPPPVAAAAPAEPRRYRVTFAPGRDVFRCGADPINLLRDLAELGPLGDVAADVSALPALGDLDPDTCYLGWSTELTTTRTAAAVRDVFCFLPEDGRVSVDEIGAAGPPASAIAPEPLPPAAAPPAPPAPAASAAVPAAPAPAPGESTYPGVERRAPDRSSIRVPVEKVDRLVNLIEELIVSQSMLNQLVGRLSPEAMSWLWEAASAPDAPHELMESVVGLDRHLRSLCEVTTSSDRNLRELQERVMAVRMVPIGTITGRFPRLVRELSGTLGKKIRFEIAGEDTELDKQVIERVGDPLMHLIRNSADHGLESPAERAAAGKPEEGVIRLTAAQRGDSVLVEVSDDGRGLDLARIRAKAVARGVIAPTDTLTDDEVRELIFRPGFSTAEAVTDVSGRGVGMDVVKSNIAALNGSVAVASEPGRGTRVRIKLPLTMAILDGLCLGIGEDVYVVPLLNVVESLRPRPAEVKSVLGRGTVVMVRGEPVPLWSLAALVDRPAAITDPAAGLVVIVEGDGKRYGLLVDELIGQSQVVIKTLEANYRRVDGIVGATILGDGRVGMILNVHGLPGLGARGLPPATAEPATSA